jgi:hypothetical protein
MGQQRNYGRPLNGRQSVETITTGRKTGYELRNAAGAVLQASETLSALTRYFEDKVDCVIVDCARQAVVWPPQRVSGIEST